MTEAVATGGQAPVESQGPTTQAPATANGSGGPVQTTQSGPATTAEESFFDPRSIQGKPELEQAYKQMQGEFTKRMQGIRSSQQKLEQYAAFERDPVGTIKALSQQYGLQVLQGQEQQSKDFNPQSWDDVEQHFREKFRKEELTPLTREVRDLKRQNIEQQLDTKFPDWRTYEMAMMDVLKVHPTLVNDPDTLYRMAVPSQVLEARATKAAMEKLKAVTESSNVSGGATPKQTTSEPTGKLTFNQAVEIARKRVNARGLSAPH